MMQHMEGQSPCWCVPCAAQSAVCVHVCVRVRVCACVYVCVRAHECVCLRTHACAQCCSGSTCLPALPVCAHVVYNHFVPVGVCVRALVRRESHRSHNATSLFYSKQRVEFGSGREVVFSVSVHPAPAPTWTLGARGHNCCPLVQGQAAMARDA